jgi:formate dehydrogenase beta subunit
VAHGHEAAVSIDKMLNGEDIADRPLPAVELISQKMGIHEWSYDNDIALDQRYKVPHRDKVVALKDIKAEVELGFDPNLALAEAGRCLNSAVQTVFTSQLCIECDACVDICPMDCCRSSRRLGGEDVQVVVRSGFEEMKASPWEKEDAMHEGIPIHNYLVPKFFTHENGKLTGITFEKVKAEYDAKGRRKLVPAGEPDQHFPCDDVLVAVGQENAFPWIEKDCGIEFDEWHMPKVDTVTFASTNPKVFFGGDAAFGPKNIIWAVAHGHEAAVSIDKLLNGENLADRPQPAVSLMSQKMGIHEWSYDNEIDLDKRYKVPHRDLGVALKDIKAEVELGFDPNLALAEAGRCLNCDVQTVFTSQLCIECDACVDICPMDCITFTQNGEEAELRTRLNAPAKNLSQDLYVANDLKTGRVMVKDEDVCLHCGLCAERCPTGAWDMQKFLLEVTHAGTSCRPPRRSAA